MSLFDVIRYPISDPPTPEELEALPGEIFNRWVHTSDWCDVPRTSAIVPSRLYIGNWYQTYHIDGRLKNIDWHDIQMLRRMIREYEE